MFIGILNFPEIQSISGFVSSVTAERQEKMTHVMEEIWPLQEVWFRCWRLRDVKRTNQCQTCRREFWHKLWHSSSHFVK